MLLTLQHAAARDVHRAGGKGASLAQLVAAGLPVPPAIIVPVDVFRAFLDANGLRDRVRAGDPGVAEAIRRGELDPALAGALREASARLGDRLAVRSSAAEEDGAQASHAGQLLTVLGVAPGDETEAALKACWASALSGRVEAYRQALELGRRGGLPRVAVVIQGMVRPRSAGVLFTVNPLTGSWREMSVEAAWGLGEAVVGGLVVPDFYRVRRPRRSPRPVQRVLARVRLQELERQVRPQRQAWEVVAGAPEPVGVRPSRIDQAKLSPGALLRLCRLGLRAEALMGGPQDIEWAQDEGGRFVILQSRPITTVHDVRDVGGTVWTRRFLGERWTTRATPLGWSEMQAQLHWFIGYPQTSRRLLGGEEPTRMVRFAPYLNVTVFRHLAFKLPGAPPPRFMLELLPPAEERGWLGRHAQMPDLRVYRSILGETLRERRWRRFRWNPFTNWRAWSELERRLGPEIQRLPEVPDSRAEAWAAVLRARQLTREYIGVHVTSLLFANIWFQLADAALRSQGREALIPLLLRSPAENATVRTNHALWRLGRGDLPLEDFLDRFGDRSGSAWELFSPRWREQPERALALARVVSAGMDPAEEARADEPRVREALASMPMALRSIVILARRYLQLREDQRFFFDGLLWRWKCAYTWLEADTGLALRFLDAVEVEAYLDGRLAHEDAARAVARRQDDWRAEGLRREQGDQPPVFLMGEQAAPCPEQGRRLRGMGISVGVVTGTVRVLRSLDQADQLRDGEILVAPATDPGWTPLFSRASGLILELGGMLSHGAVVAREYGLPAIVNVSDATRALHTGQRVTLDGTRGLVWIR